MREANDKWIRMTARFIAPNGYWCWTDENQIFWRNGEDKKLTASTKKGLEKLRYILSKECFEEVVNPIYKTYVPVKKENARCLVMP